VSVLVLAAARDDGVALRIGVENEFEADKAGGFRIDRAGAATRPDIGRELMVIAAGPIESGTGIVAGNVGAEDAGIEGLGGR
jgi:hypothetical protein